MRQLPIVVVAVAAALARPAVAGPRLDITQYELDNGLDVILAPDPTLTSVVFHVWYHIGSKDETPGKTGFAHLFEHLMFKGSKHVPDGQFDVLLEAAGGWNNGTTNADRTNYFEQVPSNYAELALWLEADRLAGLWDAMNQSVLDNQRDVVKNERRQSYENRPYGVAELTAQQALWPAGHGNHNLTIGTMEDLTAASLEDVEAFWRLYYRPSNATLVVVGGFEVDRMKASIEKYLGWIPKRDKPATRVLDKPVEPLAGPAELTTTDRVQVPKVLVGFRTDAPYKPSTIDLAVVAQVLGGGKTSRLYRRLVMKDRLATEVEVDQTDQILGGELWIHGVARERVDAKRLRTAIEEELAVLRDKPITDAELARARRTLEASRLRAMENPASRADSIATWWATTGKPDFLDEELALLRAVTPATIQASAKTWLAETAAVWTTISPAPATKRDAP
jgi:zinc protease